MSVVEDPDVSNSVSKESRSLSKKNAKEHVEQLQRLQEKDPEFYQYLKDHDKELLEFDDEDIDENAGTDLEDDEDSHSAQEKLQKAPEKVITTAMVDSWCKDIKEYGKLGAVRSLLRAFRTACHYGDDRGNGSKSKFSIISSSVFNRIMVFVLNEMDGILRGVLKAPNSGGKKETIMDLMTTKVWKKNGCLMKLYLGNALHILTQMTDEQMISFTLKRVKASAVFLAAFPTLLRKYIKVALHSWGNGRGALPVVSFLFLRDLCVRLGSDCLDTCLKGVYKAYIMNCKLAKNVSRSKLQHINFLGNCVSELYGVDIPSAYQHAFVFIRQLAVILRGALTERGSKVVKDNKQEKGKQGSGKSTNQEKVYQKVYDWQFISCLELWTSVICAYSSEADFRPLAYPLTQIISGVASLVPTARYFPLRLRCVRMLNRLAGATGTFIPVSTYLLDMLEMKELKRPPTGGVGKAVNLLGVKQVDKTTLKTRAFQEACIYSVVEELAEHLAQWSYSVAFFELSFVPLVQLRSFCKSTNIDRFRREIKALIQQVEANIEFTNAKRMVIDFSPNDPAIESFLKAEKESGSSPLSRFASSLRLRAQQRSDSMVESSVFVGEEASVFGSKLSKVDDEEDEEESEGEGDEEEGAAVFSSSWLPEKKPQVKEKPKSSKKHHDEEEDVAIDEDLVKDLVLSSDDEEDVDGGREGSGDDEPNGIAYSEDEGEGLASTTLKRSNNKVEGKRKKPASRPSKTKRGSRGKRTKKTRV
ncbi:nucleolar complex protein 2-like protein isoform X2 [Iris pallida]|uniref:Nucleolar complex protein 2-like protein isoform X2 n=1 Tax=Iris pallida TaxID=29817 RepID=A0AAX6DYA8_IRIPA|nr:nucleolar complex protein 2-like protein isoform X2 [Iris pallida]